MPIDDTDRKRIVQAIRTYIARERISREEFARRTRLGKSTVDKLVVGIFSEKTILQIEAQAKISLLGGSPTVEAAGDDFGRYTREDTKNYIGEYVSARPSFHEDGLIHAFHVAALRRYYRYQIRSGALQLGDRQNPLRYVAHNEPVARFFHQQIAATLMGHAVQLIDVETGAVRRTFDAGAAAGVCVFSTDGTRMATGGYDQENGVYYARLWEVATGKELRRFAIGFELNRPVMALALSHDGGLTWRESGGGLPPGFAIAVADDDPDRILYAARNRLYLSVNGGVFWRSLEPELPDVVAVAWID